MKRVQIIGCLLLSLVASQCVLAAKVYTWTDSKGVVHFGERPPKNVKATLVKTRTGHSDPTPAATPPANANTTATTATQPTSFKDPERCAKARNNLNVLNSVARIKTVNEDGITVYLTEEDKAQQRIIAQQMIDEACE